VKLFQAKFDVVSIKDWLGGFYAIQPVSKTSIMAADSMEITAGDFGESTNWQLPFQAGYNPLAAVPTRTFYFLPKGQSNVTKVCLTFYFQGTGLTNQCTVTSGPNVSWTNVLAGVATGTQINSTPGDLASTIRAVIQVEAELTDPADVDGTYVTLDCSGTTTLTQMSVLMSAYPSIETRSRLTSKVLAAKHRMQELTREMHKLEELSEKIDSKERRTPHILSLEGKYPDPGLNAAFKAMKARRDAQILREEQEELEQELIESKLAESKEEEDAKYGVPLKSILKPLKIEDDLKVDDLESVPSEPESAPAEMTRSMVIGALTSLFSQTPKTKDRVPDKPKA